MKHSDEIKLRKEVDYEIGKKLSEYANNPPCSKFCEQKSFKATIARLERIIKKQDVLISENKDIARLDWLADVSNKIGNVQLPAECVERNLGCLRAAIDDAMELCDA